MKLEGGVVHELPDYLNAELLKNPEAKKTWRDITALARNEWICWITSAKKQQTIEKRLHWGVQDLSKGKRRPCCWPGCKHR